MENIQKQIEDFKKAHPEVAEAMKIFKISMKEYEQAFKFLNEPQIYTSNTTNPFIHKK
jgi:hypothetical protein